MPWDRRMGKGRRAGKLVDLRRDLNGAGGVTLIGDSVLGGRGSAALERLPKSLWRITIAVPRRRSQVVRQRSAKPPFIGSIPIGASRAATTYGPPSGWPVRVGKVLGRL